MNNSRKGEQSIKNDDELFIDKKENWNKTLILGENSNLKENSSNVVNDELLIINNCLKQKREEENKNNDEYETNMNKNKRIKLIHNYQKTKIDINLPDDKEYNNEKTRQEENEENNNEVGIRNKQKNNYPTTPKLKRVISYSIDKLYGHNNRGEYDKDYQDQTLNYPRTTPKIPSRSVIFKDVTFHSHSPLFRETNSDLGKNDFMKKLNNTHHQHSFDSKISNENSINIDIKNDHKLDAYINLNNMNDLFEVGSYRKTSNKHQLNSQIKNNSDDQNANKKIRYNINTDKNKIDQSNSDEGINNMKKENKNKKKRKKKKNKEIVKDNSQDSKETISNNDIINENINKVPYNSESENKSKEKSQKGKIYK